MGRYVHVRSLHHGVARNDESTSPYDASYNTTDPIDITVISNSSNVNGDNSNSSHINNAGLHQLVTAVTAIVGFVLIVAMCLCMKSTHTPEAERRIRRYKRGGYKKKPPNYYRLKRIQKSLIVQQVVQVDKSGQVQLRDVRTTDHISEEDEGDDEAEDISNTSSAALGEDVIEASSSVVSETNSENLVACCCICLEPYQEGDIVAWSNSSTEDCLHVFHRDCIHLWLVNPKHNDCPSCRTVILAKTASGNASINSDDDDEEDDVEGQRRTVPGNNNDVGNDDAHVSLNNNSTTSVAYYIMHGLISRANQVKFNLIGQTISFDSEDSDFDGLYYANTTRRNSVDETTRTEWLNRPSTFRRAMSFSDRIFSNTFSSTIKKQQSGTTWKPVMSADDSDTIDTALPRRASTKVMTNLKSLQQAHSLRRVVSAGPCTPLDIRKHGLDEQIRFLSSTVGNSTESNFDTVAPERLIVPFRRTSSLRHRLFCQESLSDCDEDEKRRNVKESAIDGAVVENVENTDSTEEDDIIIQKAL
jgi:Ring finger domain